MLLVGLLSLSLRKVSQHVCVSGFSVGLSAGSRVCCSLVVCGSVREWRFLGSILAAGKLSLLCAGLPHFPNILFLPVVVVAVVVVAVVVVVVAVLAVAVVGLCPSSLPVF